MDCGHYTPRSHLNTRWNEINCACQCKGCNIFKKGNMDVFAIRLQEKYGLQILKWLDELKKEDKGMRYGKSWYEEEIAKYKKLVAEIS